MAAERGETTGGHEAKAMKAHKFLGSLKDALMAAGRDETVVPANAVSPPRPPVIPPVPATGSTAAAKSEKMAEIPPVNASSPSPSAEEAARIARTQPAAKAAEPVVPVLDIKAVDGPPTTRVVRPEPKKAEKAPLEPAPRTVLMRGRRQIERQEFERDPVVGFLIVVAGPGLGSFRPVFEGNNTIGRSADNRIPIDFGDDAISNEAQAYLRYDSNDRSFLFVPNLAKTNVVSVNDKRPAGPVPLQPMDVITLGRTQVAFLPFCGGDFDWSEISEA